MSAAAEAAECRSEAEGLARRAQVRAEITRLSVSGQPLTPSPLPQRR